MLYVSISKLSLFNLPGSTFAKRSLPAVEAADLVAQARRNELLMCVSSDDLAAPYQKRSLELHVDVCAALQACGVDLFIKDFFNESFCNALEFARVQADHRLLVVELGFDVNLPKNLPEPPQPPLERAQAHASLRVSKLFTVSPKAFKFHLFEEISR